MTPKNHLRAWYAFGHGADCSQERANLYSCMRLKMARSETKNKLLEENREFIRISQAIPDNHFWKERSTPIDSWPTPEPQQQQQQEG